jgi:hypothetical protein
MNIQLATNFTKVGERQPIRSTPRGSLKLIAKFPKKKYTELVYGLALEDNI